MGGGGGVLPRGEGSANPHPCEQTDTSENITSVQDGIDVINYCTSYLKKNFSDELLNIKTPCDHREMTNPLRKKSFYHKRITGVTLALVATASCIKHLGSLFYCL